MPKKPKKGGAAAAKPNKSAFVRSLAFDMPSAEVIARAKAKGMKLTRNDVHAIRAIARRKDEQPKSSGSNHRGGGSINKSAFVRSLPSNLSAAEVIARGKAKGIRLSAAQVYTIRANARRKRPKGAIERPLRGKAPLTAASLGADSREAEFIAAALDLGLTKAEGLIAALRSRAVAAVS